MFRMFELRLNSKVRIVEIDRERDGWLLLPPKSEKSCLLVQPLTFYGSTDGGITPCIGFFWMKSQGVDLALTHTSLCCSIVETVKLVKDVMEEMVKRHEALALPELIQRCVDQGYLSNPGGEA